MVKHVETGRGEVDRVELESGDSFRAKQVVMSTGHNRHVLAYDDNQSPPMWQTAYGIEVEMENHPWPPDKAIFMDLSQSDKEREGEKRIPSFLYVLPSPGKVFLEETCLVSKVQVPFDELKRRLYRRLANLKINISQSSIIEEEASWIPLGGALPKTPQRIIGFGAAAGLVHPSSGYSIVQSLQKAGPLADIISTDLRDPSISPEHRSDRAWVYLWSAENRRRLGFYQFGSAVIAKLPVETLKEFMDQFYALPQSLWQGFLANDLPSPALVPLALLMWFRGNVDLKMALMSELFTPAGIQMVKTATSPVLKERASEPVVAMPASLPPYNPLYDTFRREQLEESMLSGMMRTNRT
jgi:lycopene epsilon-cyclase